MQSLAAIACAEDSNFQGRRPDIAFCARNQSGKAVILWYL